MNDATGPAAWLSPKRFATADKHVQNAPSFWNKRAVLGICLAECRDQLPAFSTELPIDS